MKEIKLTGFKIEEINDISGKGISFKKITIPNENCSNFFIWYEVISPNGSRVKSPIVCRVSPYQRDISQVVLHQSVIVPDDCMLTIQLESVIKPTFTGTAFINYETFEPNNELGMRVFISETDRQNAFRVALINLARFFKIPNWEYDDNQTLYDKIKEKNHPINYYLKEYFFAYNEWFRFYARIKVIESHTGRQDLTFNEKEELTRLIKRRVDTLNELQTKFDELQFEEFKKSSGLNNVDGIIL